MFLWQPPSNSFDSRFCSRSRVQRNLTPSYSRRHNSSRFNEIVTLRRTQSHPIAIGIDRPLKARALVSGDRRCATTLLPEQPNPAQPLMTMISPIPQFFPRIARPGSAQVGAGLNS